jgi:hypothetical protein
LAGHGWSGGGDPGENRIACRAEAIINDLTKQASVDGELCVQGVRSLALAIKNAK